MAGVGVPPANVIAPRAPRHADVTADRRVSAGLTMETTVRTMLSSFARPHGLP